MNDDPARTVRSARWLRKFAWINVWFWLAQHPILLAWFLWRPTDFGDAGPGLFYLAQISVAALWLSSVAWWQSTRVETQQLEESDRFPTDDDDAS